MHTTHATNQTTTDYATTDRRNRRKSSTMSDTEIEKAPGESVAPASSSTSATPQENSDPTHHYYLDALDKLEILPHMLQEGILFAGSGSALLLQAAMPGIRSDDSTHERNLATELGDALQATLSYIACLVFGTRDEKRTLLTLLAQRQPPLKGSDYYAHKPDTYLWIAATLYATATDFYQRIYGRVSMKTAEKIYGEYSVLCHVLDVPDGTWPESRQAFWKFWDEQIESLHVTPDANEFAQDLMYRTEFPRWVQSLKPLLRVITIEMLPPRLRDDYGLQSTMMTRGMYRSTMGFAVAAYPSLPKAIRGYPLRYYLTELRKHLNVV